MTQDDLVKLLAFLSILAMLGLAIVLAHLWARSREKKMATPVTPEGLVKYDNLPPAVAVAYAWSEAGANPHYHLMMQDDVRAKMPLLARALDRLVE